MRASVWPALLVFCRAALAATECLVGCSLQGISPFDEDNVVVWDQRETCDSTTVGCDVTAINYPGTFFRGALWAQSSGTDGSSGCTCDICDPYPSGNPASYMSEETSLWTRIQCYIAASEASGYDMSPCVAAVMDTGALLCIDEAYEAPVVAQFGCDQNSIDDVEATSIAEGCVWAGDARESAEMFTGVDVTVAPDTPSPHNPPTASPRAGDDSPAPTWTPSTTTPPPPVVPPASDAPSPTASGGDGNITIPPNPPSTRDTTNVPTLVALDTPAPKTPAPSIGNGEIRKHLHVHYVEVLNTFWVNASSPIASLFPL